VDDCAYAFAFDDEEVLVIEQGRDRVWRFVDALGRLSVQPGELRVRVGQAGDRWLVAVYRPVSWVRNARAADEVTLSRGGQSDKFSVIEADTQTAVPVLRAYIDQIKVTPTMPIVRSPSMFANGPTRPIRTIFTMLKNEPPLT
jgi:hypothetical protein